jgi:hypothetical protein
VLELFEMMSRRVNAVLALGTTDHARPPEPSAFSAKSEIFQPFRFGYSVISNQFSIDWRSAVGMCSVVR